jgi:hypothetical protein
MLRTTQIEAWTLRIVEQVLSKRQNEDSRADVKADWPTDHRKAARGIAGLANAVHGEPVLWVMGLDQHRGLTPLPHMDLAAWWPSVCSHFDGLAPAIKDVIVPTSHGVDVVALCFDTDRAPYVVKTGQTGEPQLEVPWREGTRTRSAKRADLVTLLAAEELMPQIEVFTASLEASRYPPPADPQIQPSLDWALNVWFFVVPSSERRVVLPDLKAAAVVEIADQQFELPGVHFHSPGKDDPNVHGTYRDLTFLGPGRSGATFYLKTPLLDASDLNDSAVVTVRFGIIGAPRQVVERLELQQASPRNQYEVCVWTYPAPPPSKS